MIKFDYHTHTNHSFDSSATVDGMVQRAISLGLEEYAITDHIDFTWPDCRIISPHGIAANVKAMQAAKERYADQIKILVGVEFGLRPDCEEAAAKIAKAYDFDIVIGSMHEINGSDFYYPELHKGRTKHEVFQLYFENALETVIACDSFDILGHLDYVERYARFPDKTLHHADYREIVDEILKVIIRKDKGIEINTSGFAYGLGRTHPQVGIVKRYRELGGEIITVGSDTHKPENIAHSFDKAYEVLKEAGFNHITRFCKRKPILTPLKK
ncbi:MAG: histidinol-phosphatase HisJ family protein [Defluviitaleaceae bacterium]|nr:histidinol-phosphatase HisJ family protein [Defluviitaleaceae bacterium]